MTPDPPPLPADAPGELKDFVAGRVGEVQLDPERVHWIPKPIPIVPDALMPTVKVADGGPPNTVRVSVGWGVLFRLNLRASIVDGKLRVTGGGPLHHHIEDWVRQFNRSLGTDRRLETLRVAGSQVRLRSVAVEQPLDRSADDA